MVITIYTCIEFNLQLNIDIDCKYAVCDLAGKNMFGVALFDTLEEAIGGLELYINVIYYEV
tara:strand:+ start:1006 stop:1188 length:183 start_codon:yes stop_codon:yes gene_type:complete